MLDDDYDDDDDDAYHVRNNSVTSMFTGVMRKRQLEFLLNMASKRSQLFREIQLRVTCDIVLFKPSLAGGGFRQRELRYKRQQGLDGIEVSFRRETS